MKNAFFPIIFSFPKQIVLWNIRFYQKTFSPDHGWTKIFYPHGYCKYHPSCSEYSLRAVEDYGVIKGLLLSCWRIFRCNPWSKGGVDPVPKRK